MSLHLESRIIVNKSLDQFPSYLNDPRSLPMWDRSVAKVELTSEGPMGIGSTFDTIGYPRGKKAGHRSSYRIIHLERTFNQVELTNSKIFKKAVWGLVFKPVAEGTEITCTMDLSTKWQYFFIAPLLRANKRAILADLGYLKHIIEHDQGTQEFELSSANMSNKIKLQK